MLREMHRHSDDEKNGDAASTRSTTDIEGLDEVLDGGLLRGCMYIVEKHAGTGKRKTE